MRGIPQGKLQEIVREGRGKIIFLVLDGLGGIPHPDFGKTELEAARTPNLDELGSRSSCGLVDPVAPGITPGSAPGHLSLFGYDPLQYELGRGVLEALGVDFGLREGDVAARGNFCTVDEEGKVIDRRAGRISTELCAALCRDLEERIKIEGAEIFVRPVREHRFCLILRGEDLSEKIADTDPQVTGLPPKEPKAHSSEAERTAKLISKFVKAAAEILKGRRPANMILLRGFSKLPKIPSMRELYGLRAAAIAVYPMYRGLARLLGMEVLEVEGGDLEGEIGALRRNFENFDFFYLHVKETDMAGEDGDFERKVRIIEEVDKFIPQILELEPDVLVVTGDHSTPSILRSHSWHPVPTIFFSRYVLPEGKPFKFCERSCARGTLGRIPATSLMPLALACTLRLAKYGA